MMPDRMGIIGKTQGVKASKRPNTRKPPSTSGVLFWNRRAMSTSLEKIERSAGALPAATRSAAADSIGVEDTPASAHPREGTFWANAPPPPSGMGGGTPLL